VLTLEAVHAQQPASSDPLADLALHPDAYRGAVLLSDQIEFYIKQLDPPLLARPDGSRLNDDDLWDERQGCLDTASYKLCLLTKSPSSRLMKPLTSPDSSSLDGICEFNGCMRGCFGLVGHRLTLDGRVHSTARSTISPRGKS